MDKKLHLTGALRACEAIVKDALAEIQNGQRLEREGFDELMEGSTLTADELKRRVGNANWYLDAREAQRLGLVAGVI